jgi:hypothetical protein
LTVIGILLNLRQGSCPRLQNLGSWGSTKIRVTKRLEREISGAMLNPRHGEEIGTSTLRLLARSKDYADPYPARVGLATRAGRKIIAAS